MEAVLCLNNRSSTVLDVSRYLEAGKDRELEKSHQQMSQMEEAADRIMKEKQELGQQCTGLNKELQEQKVNIEIDNDERGVIGDFTTISDIRITKVKPE